ncbi:MAG: SAM-dependent methyltransferase [Bacteroidales bacterium]|nr:SAM-dependent methyltransferase [Bacteroidales bacterium]
MTEENFSNFVLAHDDDDPARLLLSAGRWPGIDVRRAARAIEARRKVRDKIPSWLAHPAIDYPSSLSLEQCSSEETARYKQAFVPAGGTDAAGVGAVADLTGGLGVDTWMLAQRAATVDYCERNPELCAAARHNFAELGLTHVTVHEGDGVAWLRSHPGRFALIYLDPARRGGGRSGSNGRRLYDIADCEPNLLEILPLLLEKADLVLAKISPMADITRTLSQIPEIRELHVVAAAGEVKEILLLMEPLPESGQQGAPKIVAADGGIRFEFTPDEEPAAEVRYAETVGRYLFQPSKALRKAGAFRLLSARFGLAKLAPSTHLYTGDTPTPDFPGKTFEVTEVLPWNNATIKAIRQRFDRLDLTALNFPLDTDALRHRLSLPAGGPTHAFATTLSDRQKVLIVCQPFSHSHPHTPGV